MRYSTIIFDFDGTLADSEHVALEAVNAVAPEFGFSQVRETELPALRSMSAWELLQKRAHIPLWNIFKIRKLERRIAEEILKRADRVHLFDGVAELIRECRRAGLETGIVTSAARAVVVGALEREHTAVDFLEAGTRFFRKGSALRKAMKDRELDSREVLYVGDELRDIDACADAGIAMLGVAWGYNSGDALKEAGVEVAMIPSGVLALAQAL